MEEILDVINEKNEVLRQAPRKEVEEKGLLYRSAQIFVYYNNKIIIEKRSMNKSKRPGYYSNVGETVKAGEKVEAAAVRGVKEETGLDVQNIKKIGEEIILDRTYKDSFLMTLYVCEGKGEIKIQKEEVENILLLSIKEIENLIESGEKVSPALIKSLEFLKRWKK